MPDIPEAPVTHRAIHVKHTVHTVASSKELLPLPQGSRVPQIDAFHGAGNIDSGDSQSRRRDVNETRQVIALGRATLAGPPDDHRDPETRIIKGLLVAHEIIAMIAGHKDEGVFILTPVLERPDEISNHGIGVRHGIQF